MKKVKVKAGIYKLKVPQKVELARIVVTCMTGNVNFPNPNPALSVITQAADDLENASIIAADRSRLHVAEEHKAEDELDTLMAQLALYIENAAANDANKIMSSGMDIKHEASASQVPHVPTEFEGASNGQEGQAEFSWKGVAKARVYVVEQSSETSIGSMKTADGTEVLTRFVAWTISDIVTKTKLVVKGLESGTRYAFRVYAIGAGGKSNKSAEVIVKVF